MPPSIPPRVPLPPFTASTPDRAPARGPRPDTRSRVTRRRLLAAGGSLAALSGCLSAPSSSSPTDEAVEVDDGPVFGPGLKSEREEAFYAALLLGESSVRAFDRDRLGAEATAFLSETDFRTHLIGLVQVAGVNGSTRLDVVDLALTHAGFTVVLALRDDPPYSEDRVITTLLVRVRRRSGSQPEGIWVDLGIGGRDVSFSGDPVST